MSIYIYISIHFWLFPTLFRLIMSLCLLSCMLCLFLFELRELIFYGYLRFDLTSTQTYMHIYTNHGTNIDRESNKNRRTGNRLTCKAFCSFLRRICVNVPTSNSSTLWLMPTDTSTNFARYVQAKHFPSTPGKKKWRKGNKKKKRKDERM